MTSSPPSVAGVVEGAACDVLLRSSQLTRLDDGQQACNKRQKSGNRFAEFASGFLPIAHGTRDTGRRYSIPSSSNRACGPPTSAAYAFSFGLSGSRER